MDEIEFQTKARRRRWYFIGIASAIALAAIIFPDPKNHPQNSQINLDDYEVSKEPGRPCIGYVPGFSDWNRSRGEMCPANYAILASGDSTSPNKFGPPNYVNISANCCPLPFDDILTDKHVENVFEKCPDGAVMTSGADQCGASCAVRCTYINSERYMLGPEKQALYVKDPEKNSASGRGYAELVSLLDVPLALRYATVRSTFIIFDADGCVGNPYGSLMVRKSEKQCSGYYYRQLLYKDGTPVPVIPHCDAISDLYDPNAKCLVKKARKENK